MDKTNDINLLWVFEVFVDALFIMDLFVNLNRAFLDSSGRLRIKRVEIFFHYLKTGMIFDLLTAFPYEFFTSLYNLFIQIYF